MSGKSVSVKELDAKYDADAAKDFKDCNLNLLLNAIRDACGEAIAEASKAEVKRQFANLIEDLRIEKHSGEVLRDANESWKARAARRGDEVLRLNSEMADLRKELESEREWHRLSVELNVNAQSALLQRILKLQKECDEWRKKALDCNHK